MTATDPHLPDVDVARIAYAAVRAHQAACGDPVHPADPTPETLASYAAGIALVRTGSGPGQRHAAWVAWQTKHGQTGSPHAVPYDQLGEAGRRRGDLFAAVVGALL